MLDYFFVDAAQPHQAVVLNAKLEAQTTDLKWIPWTAWTPTWWEFHIHVAEAALPRGYVLGTRSQRVAVGRRCFFWLGENVRPGAHALTVSTSATEKAYVVLSRSTPGQFPKRKVQRTR